MGLAAPRKRRKIQQDPSNTTWSRSDSYGKRILKAQGWTEGAYLGAANAPQALHYSSGSTSHIRVVLREDNAGIGSSRSSEKNEIVALSSFQDILGRLNGKSEDQLIREQKTRNEVGLQIYAEQKWGDSGFVSGGYLAGSLDAPERKERQTVEETEKSNNNDTSGKGRTNGPITDSAPRSEKLSLAQTSKKGKKRRLKEAKMAIEDAEESSTKSGIIRPQPIKIRSSNISKSGHSEQGVKKKKKKKKHNASRSTNDENGDCAKIS